MIQAGRRTRPDLKGDTMKFDIDSMPPGVDEIDNERKQISSEMKRIRLHDTVITFVLILVTSAGVCAVVYWVTGNVKYAAIAASVFPVIGVLLGLTGLITVAGFRSAVARMGELNYDLVALNPISRDSQGDIEKLVRKYKQVDAYVNKVKEKGRDIVNGELAMFWEWDASTEAKTARKRAMLRKAEEEDQEEDQEE